MEYNKFVVESIETTLSGTYAVYTSESGYKTYISCFGFEVGDEVEWWDYDGYCPSKIKVNGVVTWTEEDKKEWWDWYNNRTHEDIVKDAHKQKEKIYKSKNNLTKH